MPLRVYYAVILLVQQRMNSSSLSLTSCKVTIHRRPSTPTYSRLLPSHSNSQVGSYQFKENIFAKKPSNKSSACSSRVGLSRKNSSIMFVPHAETHKNEMVVLLRSSQHPLKLKDDQDSVRTNPKSSFSVACLKRHRTLHADSQNRVHRRMKYEQQTQEKAYRYLNRQIATQMSLHQLQKTK